MKIEQILLQKIKGIKEVDFYVPVKFDFIENDEKDKELFYYRMFNHKSSFVEMSINSVTNKIVNITLVSVNSVKEVENVCLNAPIQEGNAIIDMNIFKKEHIITDNVNFDIILNAKKVYVLQESITIHKQVAMDAVNLLLDEQNNIIGYVFKDFTEHEWKEVNESIGNSVSIASQP